MRKFIAVSLLLVLAGCDCERECREECKEKQPRPRPETYSSSSGSITTYPVSTKIVKTTCSDGSCQIKK